MITLFYSSRACSLASHITLEEAGAPYTTVRVDFAKSEQRQPEYQAINPKGRVPTLVTDGGIDRDARHHWHSSPRASRTPGSSMSSPARW